MREGFNAPGDRADEVFGIVVAGLRACSHISTEELAILEKPGRVVVLAGWYYEGSYGPEHSATVLVQLWEGGKHFGVINESEDSSGHGCQCSGHITFFDTLEQAINLGLSGGERENYHEFLESKSRKT